MTAKWTILYVDVDTAAQTSLAAMLTARGYVVRCARDRAGALAHFRHEPVDALLVDLGRADASVALCLEMRALARVSFLPTVLLTSDAEPAVRVRALREGIDDAWQKPVSFEECEARLAVLLRLRQREQALRAETDRFRAIAFTDPLTQLGNRRAFDAELRRAWARTSRSEQSLALFLIDIDYFKRFNDRYGHRAGDAVLRAVGRVLAREIRAGDQAFRFGGEEFAVLAPDVHPDGVMSLAERLREAVSTRKVPPPPNANWRGSLSVTASVGVAVAPSLAIPSRGALIEAADRALYEAKAAGRDRVAAWHRPGHFSVPA